MGLTELGGQQAHTSPSLPPQHWDYNPVALCPALFQGHCRSERLSHTCTVSTGSTEPSPSPTHMQFLIPHQFSFQIRMLSPFRHEVTKTWKGAVGQALRPCSTMQGTNKVISSKATWSKGYQLKCSLGQVGRVVTEDTPHWGQQAGLLCTSLHHTGKQLQTISCLK